MPKGIRIRNAKKTDIEDMLLLLRDLFNIEADFFFDEKKQRKGLIMMLDGCDKYRCVKVAESEGKVIAMCTAQTLVSTAEGGMVAVIEDMVVAGPYRKTGIGRSLMAEIEKWAESQGVTRLQLLADRENLDALRFYHKIGWAPTGLICLRRKRDFNIID